MNAPFKAPSPVDPAEAPLWDLTDLYSSPEDPRVSADLTAARETVDRLGAFEGRLATAGLAATELSTRLDEAIDLYQQASDLLGGLGAFAFLRASTARDDAAAQAFEADIRAQIAGIATATVWLTLEINRIDDAALSLD